MKIEQSGFIPVVITLETEADQQRFIELIQYGNSKRPAELKEMAKFILDWLKGE